MYFTGVRGGGPPLFVYGIIISIAFFFNIFAVNMLLQYRKRGKFKDYLYGEYLYIVLSLVALTLMADVHDDSVDVVSEAFRHPGHFWQTKWEWTRW